MHWSESREARDRRGLESDFPRSRSGLENRKRETAAEGEAAALQSREGAAALGMLAAQGWSSYHMCED